MATDTVLADILKDMMKAFRKADPVAAAAFKKKNQGFGERAAQSRKAAVATEVTTQKTEEWKPVKTQANKEKIKVETGPTSSTAARDKDVLVAAGWSKAVLSSLEAV